MVKFEFTLSDADAENLFGCVNSSIGRSNEKILDAMAEQDYALVRAYTADIEYLKELKKKLLNTRVEAGE